MNFILVVGVQACIGHTNVFAVEEIDTEGFGLSDTEILDKVKQRRGRKKGGLGALRGRKTEAKPKPKRGRPRGSKAKPKQQVIDLPISDDDFEWEDASARARHTWKVAKQLGVVYKGREDEIVQRLEKQLRENHPNLH